MVGFLALHSLAGLSERLKDACKIWAKASVLVSATSPCCSYGYQEENISGRRTVPQISWSCRVYAILLTSQSQLRSILKSYHTSSMHIWSSLPDLQTVFHLFQDLFPQISLSSQENLDMYIPWGLFPFLSPLRRWCGGRYLSATVNFHFTVLWVVWLWSSHWFHLCRLRRRMVFGLQTHLWDEIATLTTKSVSQGKHTSLNSGCG